MKILHPESARIGDELIAEDELVLAITRNELAALAGGLNESLEAIDDWEFETRLGLASDKARILRDRITELLRDSFRPG